MKKSLVLLVCVSLLGGLWGRVCAQQGVRHFEDGDYVTISFTQLDEGTNVLHRYYMVATSDGLGISEEATDKCLWQVEIPAQSDTAEILLRDVSTNYFLDVQFTNLNDPWNTAYPTLTSNEDQAARFRFFEQKDGSVDDTWAKGKYRYGKLYHKRTFDFTYYQQTLNFIVGQQWANNQMVFDIKTYVTTSVYIEKWERKGEPVGYFTPAKVVFSYENEKAAGVVSDSTKAASQDVTFAMNANSDSYLECVNRPEEVKLDRKMGSIELGDLKPTFYWLSSGDSKSKISQLNPNDYSHYSNTLSQRNVMKIVDKGNSTFSILTVGSTLYGLQYNNNWIDYADQVIAEYTHGGKTYTQSMRVVRKSYHEDVLPTLTFSINPVTYTFAIAGETKPFTVIPTHQHGRVVYNVDNQVEETRYDVGGEPKQLKLDEPGWSLSWNTDTWFSVGKVADNNVSVVAQKNEGGVKRSGVLKGTFSNKSDANHPHEGTFEIPVHQRAVAGGIQFYTQAGEGATAAEKKDWDQTTDEQKVHTAERTIYYESGQEVELRLPESGFSGYMRWYDHTTGKDPYYNNESGEAPTTWVLSPRAADGQPFSAINTPQNASVHETEGRSWGLYAINKADGGILDEENTSNPAPILRGWTDGKEHTMACDVSAYTDYEIAKNATTTRINSIKEPTLSYRQLFHLKPATEIANRFDTLSGGRYLEEYHYKAPTGTRVLLATEFRYKKYRSHLSEMCYFYKGSNGRVYRIDANTPVKWYEQTLQANGSYSTPQVIASPEYPSELDYLVVRSGAAATKVYTLVLPPNAANGNDEIRIAKFTVEFVDKITHGPSQTVLISQQKMYNEYKVLEYINFDQQSTHLKWEDISFGYMYSTEPLKTKSKRRADQGLFPFYGEYFVTESVNTDWVKQTAHGGTGKSLYVDGTMEPGLVASISTNATICAGQTMYCSAWFCNPTPSSWTYGEGNPIFRCNVQGRNIKEILGNDTIYYEWEDVETYFVGELIRETGWQQINFPLKSAHTYDETRVSIYNFATTNLGNDFMVDDITLYVSQLPLAAYQGEMACRSLGTDDNTTSAVAVLRLDYSNINAGENEYLYYQIYNETQNLGEGVNLQGDAAYYHESHDDDGNHELHKCMYYGSVAIPPATFNPELNKSTAPVVYGSVSKMLDEMVAQGLKHQKAYVKVVNNGVTKYLLYVAHILDHTENKKEAQEKLYVYHDYSLRMAYDADELSLPECNLVTPLHATKQTLFELKTATTSSIVEDDIKTTTNPVCPNVQYNLDIKVKNSFALTTGGAVVTASAKVYADWLVGDVFDDPYTEGKPSLDAEKEEIDARFKAKYGYTRGQVATAIMYDMRRVPTENSPNDNYSAKSFKELNVNHFNTRMNYDIIQHLYENGLLEFYKTTASFYLSNKDTVRYWAFPIEGTAKAIVDGKAVTLNDCVEPKWVRIVSEPEGTYFLNIAPIKRANMTAEQKAMLPTYKVLKKNANDSISLKVTEIGSPIKVGDQEISEEGQTISILLPTVAPSSSHVSLIDPATGNEIDRGAIVAGKEYHVRVKFTNVAGGNTCGEEGYVTFILAVVPDVLVWSPTLSSFNGWGKNENWRGWVDDGDGVMEAGEMVNGYVPMSGSDVIIPTMDNVMRYPHIVINHDEHYPMTINMGEHVCERIYFAPDARLQNQHLLEYNKAYVDMLVPATKWNLMSAPLEDMYTGDIFVPHTGKYNNGGHSVESSKPFEVEGFAGTRDWDAAYAFWQSFYNQDVSVLNQSGHFVQETTTAEFVPSNSLVQKIVPGSGVSVLGYGPGDQEEDLLVRLPKKDTVYYAYTPAGEQSKPHAVPSRENSHKLAFDVANNVGMDITLTNKVASNYFVFGNPTMSNIDLKAFCSANSTHLTGAYYKLNNESWNSGTALSTGDRFLSPMRAVLLQAKNSATSITVTLKPEHTNLNNQISSRNNVLTPQMIRKRASEEDTDDSALKTQELSIYALAGDAHARVVLGVHPDANDAYSPQEDALFVSSGKEAGMSKDAAVSPLNMYTVSNRVPMMTDMRSRISRVPISVLVHDDSRTETMQLLFNMSSNWEKVCYFCDDTTGLKIRIYDGMLIQVEMPENHGERYYIEGPDPYNSGGGVTTSTTHPIEEDGANGAQLYVYPEGNGKVLVTSDGLIQSVVVYDMLGRVVASKEQQLLSHEVRLNVPVGVCVVEAVMQNGMRQRARVIVK